MRSLCACDLVCYHGAKPCASTLLWHCCTTHATTSNLQTALAHLQGGDGPGTSLTYTPLFANGSMSNVRCAQLRCLLSRATYTGLLCECLPRVHMPFPSHRHQCTRSAQGCRFLSLALYAAAGTADEACLLYRVCFATACAAVLTLLLLHYRVFHDGLCRQAGAPFLLYVQLACHLQHLPCASAAQTCLQKLASRCRPHVDVSSVPRQSSAHRSVAQQTACRWANGRVGMLQVEQLHHSCSFTTLDDCALACRRTLSSCGGASSSTKWCFKRGKRSIVINGALRRTNMRTCKLGLQGERPMFWTSAQPTLL